ncbi:MAG: MFS transporter [Patescibacteria group bacterium]
MKQLMNRTFSSLRVRNYRLYFFGQIISYSGTFLQALAQDWLVLKLTNSGTMLGLVLAFQYGPTLIFGPYGGLIADRLPKYKFLFLTQGLFALEALILGILVLTDRVEMWMVFVCAFIFGLISCFDTPTRQSFVPELVQKDEIRNALSLWALLISVCKIVGPAIAGALILWVGIGYCFVINAVSYIPVFIGLLAMRTKELRITPPAIKAKQQIRESFRYVVKNPTLFIPIMMVIVIGTFTFEWQASLPLFAKFVLNGDAGTYSILASALGVGMLFGGLFNAAFGKSNLRSIVWLALLCGISATVTAFADSLLTACVGLFFVGVFYLTYASTSNSTLQIESDPTMRGRVIAFSTMATQGSTAIGGPLIGWISEMLNPRWGIAVGGVAAILASLYGFSQMWIRRK